MAEYTAASRGVSNTALGLGIAGTALGLLNNGGSGILNIGNNDKYATKEAVEASLTISAKQSEIDMLKSEQRENEKLIDVYKEVMAKINANAEAQNAINAQQSVYNCQANSNIAVLTNQVAALNSLTKMYVPSTNVTPQPMNMYNSWTAPTA